MLSKRKLCSHSNFVHNNSFITKIRIEIRSPTTFYSRNIMLSSLPTIMVLNQIIVIHFRTNEFCTIHVVPGIADFDINLTPSVFSVPFSSLYQMQS